MSLQLFVVSGPEKDRVFTLHPGDDLMLGRGANSAYKLTDPRASRSHCQLLMEGDKVTVIDNGGSGGTLVNGKAVQKQILKLGDVLHVGDTQLRLQMGDFPLDVAMEVARPSGATTVQQKAVKVHKLSELNEKVLAHFHVGPTIGEGTSGMMFHATDEKTNVSVALKVLLPEFATNDDEMQRFIRAMKTMLNLKHPNLVRLLAAGKSGPYCWVAMEYVAGENMAQAIERIGVAGMLDWRHGFRVAVHVARALEYAHGKQIIHRNITPKNILLEAATKTVKLGDLMLAKALEGSMAKQITRPGEIIGDVAYMSPERTRGMAEVDGRSDIYGLGATVYALLTGRPPFEGSSLIEKITKIRQAEPTKPTKYQLSIPHRFELCVMKMLAKRPEDRHQTASVLLKELNAIGKIQNITV
jgi:serine/threonine protein kinase